jgi:hypothetical protein
VLCRYFQERREAAARARGMADMESLFMAVGAESYLHGEAPRIRDSSERGRLNAFGAAVLAAQAGAVRCGVTLDLREHLDSAHELWKGGRVPPFVFEPPDTDPNRPGPRVVVDNTDLAVALSDDEADQPQP